MITMGPTGRVIKGHVLDVGHTGFLRALKDYDPQLYIAWNPKKLQKHGCWEIRRTPLEKSVKTGDISVFQGNTIVFPKWHEINLVHHVLDLLYLNYNAIEKLKIMDMWNHKLTGHKGKNLTQALDYNEAKHEERVDQKSAEQLEYGLKQMRSEMRWFREYINSGGNPYAMTDHWK